MFVVLKPSAFYFEISSFSSPNLLQLACGIQIMAQCYRYRYRVHRRQGFKL